MSDLLDEIKEDLTREKYALLWQKFGNYIIGAALAALVLTAVGIAVDKYMESRYASYSDALYEANMASGDESIKKYDYLIENGNGTYKAIAGLRKAAIFLQSSKNNEALAVYKVVVGISDAPKELKDIAKLLYVAVSSNLAVDNKELIDADAKKYLQESIDGGSIFKYSAMELNAFNEIGNKNYTKAKEIFSELTQSADAPQSVSIRAKEMLNAIANMNDAG